MLTSVNDNDLTTFITTAKSQQISDEMLLAMLKQNGWSESRIYRALITYYQEKLQMPVPVCNTRTENARDAFLYLLNFLTLSFWSIALGELLSQLVNYWIPIAWVHNYESLVSLISWQLATIIITFPIFLYVHNFLARELRVRPSLYDSTIRRWLTYVALVIAAIIVICEAIWTLNTCLSGAITVNFILQSLIIFFIGGGVFAYYLSTLNPRTPIDAN